ncbi:MAG: orotidine-5'-phosphate decarboxylase, partial [Selenomonadaceae bacterium]|nr:orotidine-5'-phosphate decarboxylase [Selenomonadaceae bacterium]
MADERLIVALDFHNFDDVKNLVNELGDDVNFYKVGMELFYSVGIDVVTWLKSLNKKIFLDLKLCDIPNTTANGLCSLMNLGADIMNIHASGGFTMMKTAADKLREESARLGIDKPKLIAVTILTSVNQTDWEGLGYSQLEI